MKLLNLLPEALGVPKDLLKVNKAIYDKLISELEKDKITDKEEFFRKWQENHLKFLEKSFTMVLENSESLLNKEEKFYSNKKPLF